jgi:hypothetical protein
MYGLPAVFHVVFVPIIPLTLVAFATVQKTQKTPAHAFRKILIIFPPADFEKVADIWKFGMLEGRFQAVKYHHLRWWLVLMRLEAA